MDPNLFAAISITPIPTIIVVAGIFFLVLSVASIKGIKPSPQRQKNAAIIGISLLLTGILLYLPTLATSLPSATTETPTILPSSNTNTPAPTYNTANNSNLNNTTPEITETPKVNGFENSCINSKIWTPYTVNINFPKEGSCWNLSSRGLSAFNRELLISIKTSEQSGSVYMPLPESGSISLDVQIDKFTVGGKNGNLAIGIGNPVDWLQSGKFLFFRLDDPNSSIQHVYGKSIVNMSEATIGKYELGTPSKITFEIKGLVLNIYLDNKLVVPSVTLAPSQKEVFWIGYRLPTDSELVASISNFTIEK